MSTEVGSVPGAGTRTWTRAGTRTWLIIAAVAGLAFGLAAGPVLALAIGPRAPLLVTTDEQPREHTISVTGSGRIFLVPDVAEIRLGVVVQRPKVKDARAAAAEAMNGVIDALRKAGIADRDIRTSTLSLQPVYEYRTDGGAPRIVGYELRNGLTVTVRDLDAIGPAIDDAMAAGATTLDQLTFSLADPSAGERQAREAAMADARGRADTLARAAGVKITGVVSISESVSTPPWPWREGEGAGVEDGTPIMPGVNEVVVSVSVVYLID